MKIPRFNARYIAGSGGVTEGGKFTENFAKGDSPGSSLIDVGKISKGPWPDLEGSEKQVSWAENIRHSLVRELTEKISKRQKSMKIHNDPTHKYTMSEKAYSTHKERNKVDADKIKKLVSTKSASTIIDMR